MTQERWLATVGAIAILASGIVSFVFREQLNWFTYNILISVAAFGFAFVSVIVPGILRTQFSFDVGKAAKLSAFGPMAIFALLMWFWTGKEPAVVGFCDLSGIWRCSDDKGTMCHNKLKLAEVQQDGTFVTLINERYQESRNELDKSEGYMNPKTNLMKTQRWGDAVISKSCDKIDFLQSTVWIRAQ